MGHPELTVGVPLLLFQQALNTIASLPFSHPVPYEQVVCGHLVTRLLEIPMPEGVPSNRAEAREAERDVGPRIETP